ncbi:MAG TPA: 2OG-Fe(II) oxygenase [Allosphingosinicella sp.]|jgi:prolyl 4-hydroxylase
MQSVAIDPDRTDLSRLGSIGRQALLAHDDVSLVEGRDLELFLVFDFLSGAECRSFVRAIDTGASPSTLYKGTEVEGFRTSFTCHFAGSETLVNEIDGRLSRLFAMDAGLGEPLQGQRYRPGEQFKPHNDYFHSGTDYWEVERSAGQRTWTAMAYLNDVDGGETRFPAAGLSISPTPGMLVVWNNMDRDGRPNPATLHAGTPVSSGTKYVLTKWYRQFPFQRRIDHALALQASGTNLELVV